MLRRGYAAAALALIVSATVSTTAAFTTTCEFDDRFRIRQAPWRSMESRRSTLSPRMESTIETKTAKLPHATHLETVFQIGNADKSF